MAVNFNVGLHRGNEQVRLDLKLDRAAQKLFRTHSIVSHTQWAAIYKHTVRSASWTGYDGLTGAVESPVEAKAPRFCPKGNSMEVAKLL